MKLAKVVLDIPTLSLEEPFTYFVCDGLPNFDMSTKIPSGMYSEIQKTHQNLLSKIDIEKVEPQKYPVDVGCCVIVPFGRTLKIGYVVRVYDDSKLEDDIELSKIKPVVCAVSRSYFGELQAEFAQYISATYVSPISTCVRLFIPSGTTPKLCHGKNGYYAKKTLSDNPRTQDPTASLCGAAYDKPVSHAFNLTPGQLQADSVIQKNLDSSSDNVVLLDGVTGSGKTEVYLRAIQKVLSLNKTAIVLVPEISLTPQTVGRFKERFGDVVAVIHSKMTQGARYKEWLRMDSGEAKVVVGARSALFSPLKNVGIIVIDEEHDSSYKQDSSPRYLTRECALWLCKKHKAPLVLGSATPSIESLYNCEKEQSWTRVVLPNRANNAKMPDVELVDMGAEFSSGHKSLFSNRLKTLILQEIELGHKVILLHNRRGFANYMFCRNCGFIPTCSSCSTSMTYHERLKVDTYIGNEQVRGVMPMLTCHHCGSMQRPFAKCPKCGSVYVAKYGAGTQSVEDQLTSMLADYPQARIVRMDADTTKSRDGHQKCLEEFGKPGAAVLVGTQMIAKGLDFKDVTLVGVILADTNLSLPDFRANERTFQLISQVAGRAGRSDLEGKVIVQTYCPDNIALRAASQYKREMFLKDELPKRKILQLSPYVNMANILFRGPNEAEVKKCAQDFHDKLIDYRRNVTGDNWLIGDALSCALGKISNNYRYHVLVKCNKMFPISSYVHDVLSDFKSSKNVKIAIDLHPYSLL